MHVNKLVFLAVLCANACSKQQDLDHYEANLSYLKGGATINGLKAKIGDSLKQGSEISVAEGSMAMVQFPNAATVALKEKSRMKVTRLERVLSEGLRIDLSQDSGASFSKVEKGQSRFVIRTPTAVAGVRGTSFYIEVEAEATRFKLLDGKLETFRQGGTGEKAGLPVILEAGQAIVFTGDTKYKPIEMNHTELSALQIMYGMMADSKNEVRVMSQIIEAHFTGKSDIIDSLEHKDEQSLAAIKAKYGKIARIRTVDGRILEGFFMQIGDKMDIITSSGKVTVPISKVIKVTPIH